MKWCHRRWLGSMSMLAIIANVAGCHSKGSSSSSITQQAKAVQSLLCALTLERLAYDTPGTDQAEVMVIGVSDGQSLGADAGASLDPACQPAWLELINGSNAACDVYRRIPLQIDPAVTDPGASDPGLELSVCSPSSELAPCDVGNDEHGVLPNGWIQNGPADGFRVLGGDGSVLLAHHYDGTAPCFDGSVELGKVRDSEVLLRCDDDIQIVASPGECAELDTAPTGDDGAPPAGSTTGSSTGSTTSDAPSQTSAGSSPDSEPDADGPGVATGDPESVQELWGEARITHQTTTGGSADHGVMNAGSTTSGSRLDSGVPELLTSLEAAGPGETDEGPGGAGYSPADLPSRHACSLGRIDRPAAAHAMCGLWAVALVLVARRRSTVRRARSVRLRPR